LIQTAGHYAGFLQIPLPGGWLHLKRLLAVSDPFDGVTLLPVDLPGAAVTLWSR
jgi:hypothetical protein